MSDLQAIESWAGALLAKLTPSQRAQIARKTGMALRRSQSQRIAAQKNPDGSAYAPRAKNTGRFRQKSGTIKRRTMFSKLRTARFMNVDATASEVGVGFLGRAAQIAETHQEGATHRSRRTGRAIVTPKRELLGFSKADLQIIQDTLLDHLTASN